MPIDLSIFHKALKAIEEENTERFFSLTGSSNALFFSMFKDSCLLLCGSEDAANEFYSDAVFWSESLGIEKPVLIPPKGDPRRLKNLQWVYNLIKQSYRKETQRIPLYPLLAKGGVGDFQGKTKFIASVDAALSPVWHKDKLPLLRLAEGTTAGRDFIIETVKDYGYVLEPLVSGQGEFSIRGAIIDVFPPEEEFPVRIEFFGDDIESLRYFDTDTQRTIKELKEISIGPAAEPEEGPNLMDILKNNLLILNEPYDIKRHYSELFELTRERRTIHFSSLPLEGEGFSFDIRSPGGFGLLLRERKTIEEFVKRVKELQKQYDMLIASSSEGQAKRLRELFLEEKMEVPILKNSIAVGYKESPVITVGELSRGFVYHGSVILTGRDIFGEKPAYKAIKKSRISGLISSIEDFQEGDYLVHKEHGIGRFLGVKKQKVEDYEGDFITIEYLEDAKLHVPLERIDSVQKYNAPEGVKPRIDRLGGKTWEKTKQKVKQKVKEMAERLLSLYARRSTMPGYTFSDDTELHREFDGFFPYEETPDQLTSIDEIKRDMENPNPMDRLLCGDVGYGKTEIVMRACFKAVYDSKQVAVLVPTTILAEQHYDTFTSRFSAFPIRIDFLSRFKSKAEQRQTLKALAEGSIDIIIGTHRLLAKDVIFHDLGLLVIDEEHKFGVAHKEKIKALKTNVDVLTLSATPIPRTLHMALSGIRAMSVIETPPEDRLSVKSFVVRFNPQIIKDALQKELDRGGQAFFVHNRIQDIHGKADFLRKLLFGIKSYRPDVKIAVAHGQMREKDLERIMRSFFRKEIDVLVSTAIIGSGLDIPTANTIIINRADKFGLADLYQLRGRVGRSNVRAYAYFLIPGEDIITAEARKKLQAIQEMSYLGAGFRLALKDLEIRGAGNLLGSEQSGHIEAVGFDLYLEMLEQAVAELKGEKIAPKIEPLIDLKITAVIPEEYIDNPDLRLSIYRKIASAKDSKTLKELIDELKDRFGPPPEETLMLIEIMEIKLMAKKLAIAKMQNMEGRIRIIFAPETPVPSQKILSLYSAKRKHLKFLPDGGFELDLRGKPWGDMFRRLKEILEELHKGISLTTTNA